MLTSNAQDVNLPYVLASRDLRLAACGTGPGLNQFMGTFQRVGEPSAAILISLDALTGLCADNAAQAANLVYLRARLLLGAAVIAGIFLPLMVAFRSARSVSRPVTACRIVDLQAGFPLMLVAGNGHQTRLLSDTGSIPKSGIGPACCFSQAICFVISLMTVCTMVLRQRDSPAIVADSSGCAWAI